MVKSISTQEEVLQIAEKKREVKSKGEKEKYSHLNAEFQRIARRDQKVFCSDQCKEIEENNRMGKTRGLFKKIRDIKGTFHAKMGLIKEWKLYTNPQPHRNLKIPKPANQQKTAKDPKPNNNQRNHTHNYN